jgi:hypothetical protein
VCENDIICFNECWVKCPKEFELNGYEKNMCQEKNATAVVLLCFIKKMVESIFCNYEMLC